MPLCRVRIISSHNYLIHQKHVFLQVFFSHFSDIFCRPKTKKPDREMSEKPVRHGPFFIYAKEMALMGENTLFRKQCQIFFQKKFAIHSEQTLGLPD